MGIVLNTGIGFFHNNITGCILLRDLHGSPEPPYGCVIAYCH